MAPEKLNGKQEKEEFVAKLIKFDENYSAYVLVPQSINASDEELSRTVNDFYNSLMEARNKLSLVPSKFKSNGRMRSVRERRDIFQMREKQSRNIRQALEVFRGNIYGVIELIPTIDKESNKVEASGFKIHYEQS